MISEIGRVNPLDGENSNERERDSRTCVDLVVSNQ